ncbi:MAG: hypothetical protein C4586_02095 [Anaerolineaceae bacterium]|nr:MAG: hypothetical protein C4586_02095 [Anaerolineaceae bacterium]
MTLKEFNEKYGRVVLIVAVVIIWALILWSMWANGYVETWSLWKIPTVMPPFIDFRLIPSGAEAFRSGFDPAVSNPNDPAEHIFNYPKIWYVFFYTGITQADTIWICIILIVLFFATLFAFPDKLFTVDALMMLAVVFSPACILLYERGNVDLVFFILCGLTILLVSRSPVWAVIVLSLASFFKFFPFFGVSVFLQKDRNKFFKPFMASILIFAGYISFNINSLSASWNLTQRGTFLSYGVFVIFDILYAYVRYYLLQIFSESQAEVMIKVMPYLVALFLLASLFLLGTRVKDGYESNSERNLAAFRVGASIYVGTFLLGNNWDYRLAFLIFTIPQLSRWMFASNSRRRWLISGVFAAILISCWYAVIRHHILLAFGGDYELQFSIFDETVNWILFGGLTYLLVASVPKWFRTFDWFPSAPRIDAKG